METRRTYSSGLECNIPIHMYGIVEDGGRLKRKRHHCVLKKRLEEWD